MAKVQEMQAKLVEAEAQIPMAISEAFRQGNLGVMDYYRLRNVQADTDMRSSISKGEGEESIMEVPRPLLILLTITL